ncbi:hypothetical protein [Luedemannella helvata]|uniref:Uncharacterized protein n=1 Tax=Luedemannella helvata TaxID=349315 RepID=A0ABN2K0X4_9ACTN
MRHLLSLVLSIILTPVVFFVSGYASIKFGEAVESGTVAPTLLAVAAIAVAGAAYGVLILARLSPVGTVLAGLALLGPVGWALVDPGSYLDVTPDTLFGQPQLFERPVNAVTAILALPLLFTIASPRRWRRHAHPAAAGPASAAPDYPTPDPTPTYSPSYSPAYTPPSTTTPYSPYPPVSSTSSGGLGGDDTKVDDLNAEDTVANPKPAFPTSSPYGSPPVPTQPTSPEDWPRA